MLTLAALAAVIAVIDHLREQEIHERVVANLRR